MTYLVIPTPTLLALLLLNPLNVFAALPKVDFSRMGTVAVGGAFAGLDLFDPAKNLTFNPQSSTLLLRQPDGSLLPLAETNTGGTISTACTLSGKLFFAGSFSSIANVQANNIAAYSPSTGSFSPLGGQAGGLNGQVQSLYCDSSNSVLWAGGAFTAPSTGSSPSFGPSVARYYPTNDTWSPAPFFGLSGAASQVLSITPDFSNSSLLFSGSFLTHFTSNISLPSNVSNPDVPVSSGATPYTTSLVPVPLGSAQVVAGPSSNVNGFGDPSNILCPSGPDGPGSSYRGQDGSEAQITVRAFSFITASGIRLGNTFLDGYGTSSFSVTAIPGNGVLQLTYVDPATQQNQTCSTACPLGHNATVLYQDFLFSSPVPLTGFLLTLNGWYGPGPGLHILQLLSNGAFASAIAANNGASCYAPGPSSVQTVGGWQNISAYTSIAGTIQDVLVAQFPVGTSPSSAPSMTWHPYVSASGNYDVYLVIPGCQNIGDCNNRTSVDVTVSPGGGLQPVSLTVSQQVQTDTNQLIYSGPIYPTPPEYTATVTMTLATTPEGQGFDGLYDMVAGQVELMLVSTDISNTTIASGSVAAGTGALGFGFYEWPLAAAAVNASAVLPNSTITQLDGLSSALASALGSSVASSSNVIKAIVSYASNSVILAGQFDLASIVSSNVAAYAGGSLIKVGNGGLNGVVNAMAATSDKKTVYMGGAFTDTADSSSNRYRAIVKYDVASSSWSSLGGGLDGAVAELSLDGTQLIVSGNFTRAYNSSSDSTGVPVGGFVAFDLASQSWNTSGGFLVGQMTMAVSGKGNETDQYLAGSVTASSQYSAAGWALLENGNDGEPSVQTIAANLGTISSTVSSAATKRKRHSSAPSVWFSRAISHALPVLKRQSTTTAAGLPAAPAAPAPAVLAGAFWTNASTSNEVIILGGNFTVPAGSSTGNGVALYDSGRKTLTALQGNQPNGVVEALYVADDTLFVGGAFTLNGASGESFAWYNLQNNAWSSNPSQGLAAASGSSVVVRSISSSPAVQNTVVVAGSFATAGSLTCEAICAYDYSSNQWHGFGNGIRGDVASVDYAGNNLDVIIVGGDITLADGTAANVAAYSLTNSTWTALGSTPGPATAVGVNNQNASSIFAAGRASDGSSFLVHWDGLSWTTQAGTWAPGSSISQLKVVPLQDTHSSNSVIQNDRMLFISGSLDSESQGLMSSALYDGQSLYPYLTTSTQSGAPGTISSLFTSFSTFSFSQHKFLATGIVILISLAIATGIIFLILLVGFLWTLCSRRDTAAAAPLAEEDDDESSFRHHRPSSLLEHINAATRTTILGTAATSAAIAAMHGKGEPSQDTHADTDAWDRAATPSEAAGAIAGDGEYMDVNRPTHARYSFLGGAEGELPIAAGQELIVLDDRDQAWWYVRDPVSGREGVVPASYLY